MQDLLNFIKLFCRAFQNHISDQFQREIFTAGKLGGLRLKMMAGNRFNKVF